MVIIFRNLSIAILIWMIIFFLHGFFRELYRILKERYEDWKSRKRILHKVNKLVKEGLFEMVGRKENMRMMKKKGIKI